MGTSPVIGLTCSACGEKLTVNRSDITPSGDVLECTQCTSPIKIIICENCSASFSVNLDKTSSGKTPFTCTSCEQSFMIKLNPKNLIQQSLNRPQEEKDFHRQQMQDLLTDTTQDNPAPAGRSMLDLFASLLSWRSLLVSFPASIFITLSIQVYTARILAIQNETGGFILLMGGFLLAAIVLILVMVNSMVLAAEDHDQVNRLDPGRAFGGSALLSLIILILAVLVPLVIRGTALLHASWPVLTVILATVIFPLIFAVSLLAVTGIYFLPLTFAETEGDFIQAITILGKLTWKKLVRLPGILLTLTGILLLVFLAMGGIIQMVTLLGGNMISHYWGEEVTSTATVAISRYSLFNPPLAFNLVTITPAQSLKTIHFAAGAAFTSLSIGLTAFLLLVYSALTRTWFWLWNRDDNLS